MTSHLGNPQKIQGKGGLKSLLEELSSVQVDGATGVVRDVTGLCMTIHGLEGLVSIGDRINVKARSGVSIQSEVVGFHNAHARVMAFGSLEGIGPGCEARISLSGRQSASLGVNESWLGRVVDPLGMPIDGKGLLAPQIPATACQCRTSKRCNAGTAWRAHRFGSAGARCVYNLSAWSEAGIVCRVWCRKIHSAVHAGVRCQLRCGGHCTGR